MYTYICHATSLQEKVHARQEAKKQQQGEAAAEQPPAEKPVIAEKLTKLSDDVKTQLDGESKRMYVKERMAVGRWGSGDWSVVAR